MKKVPLIPLLVCTMVASPALSQDANSELELTYTYDAPAGSQCSVTAVGATQTALSWDNNLSAYVAGQGLQVAVSTLNAKKLSVSLSQGQMTDTDANNPDHIDVVALRDTNPVAVSDSVGGFATMPTPTTNLTDMARIWEADLQQDAFDIETESTATLTILPHLQVNVADQDKRNGKNYQAVFKITCEQ